MPASGPVAWAGDVSTSELLVIRPPNWRGVPNQGSTAEECNTHLPLFLCKQSTTVAWPSVAISPGSVDRNERVGKSLQPLHIPCARNALRRPFPATQRYGRGLPSERTLLLLHRARRSRCATYS